ncbi:hypothetical protein [Sinomonas mesophila]|uniref:hypothetical protein n=1 Tax=Sinomonas mesophila TaxID=1531955 RepID=UPI000986822C|nr:hypothetical protein [Sinomonas mesophila]
MAHARDTAVSPGRARFRLCVLVSACVSGLVFAPAGAWAAFTGAGAASLRVATYSIPAPGSVNANFVCGLSGRQATVTVMAYGKVERATSYTFTLTAPDGTSSSTTTTLDVVTLSQSSASVGSGVYTLTIQARIGSWIGAPLIRTHVCGQQQQGSGSGGSGSGGSGAGGSGGGGAGGTGSGAP